MTTALPAAMRPNFARGETALSTAAFATLAQAGAAAAGAPGIAPAPAAAPAAAAPAAPAALEPPAAAPAAPAGAQDRHPDGKFKAAEDDDCDGDETDEGCDASDDDDNGGKRGKKRASARRRERARCAAILASDAGKANPEMAQQLAFGTALNRTQAVQLLAAAPPPASGLSRAMGGYPNPPVGAGAAVEAARPADIDKGWDAAFGKTAAARSKQPTRRR